MGGDASLVGIRAASAVRRAATGTTPASATTPWWGADPMQPVMIQAAACISRFSTSTLCPSLAARRPLLPSPERDLVAGLRSVRFTCSLGRLAPAAGRCLLMDIHHDFFFCSLFCYSSVQLLVGCSG